MAAYRLSLYERSPMGQRRNNTAGPVLPVLIGFPNLARTTTWYGSDEYKPPKMLRLSAPKGAAVFVESEFSELVGR